MKRIAVLAACFFSLTVNAQINIIPAPVSIKQPKIVGLFNITPATKIVLEGSNLENSANFLNNYLQEFYNIKLEITKIATGTPSIILNYDRLDKGEGAYNLNVNGKEIYIGGDNESGVFYGVQSLIQLLPVPVPMQKTTITTLRIPFVSITDYPRFAYRGLMLDVGRHFFPVEFVKKYIDYLALHKMNYFHWHLTDDQGWRIEIKKYPRLTEVGAWRNGTVIGHYPGKGNDNKRHGGYYTQDDVKEIVRYAAERYITVVPEIEMPGHAMAAIAAYPELSCFPEEPTINYFSKRSTWAGDSTGKQVMQSWGVYSDVFVPSENTFKFLQDVVDEVVELFPSKYFHVGGDECPKDNWKRSAFCQQLMKEKGLKDEHELQSYFVQRMEKYINSKGKTIIGWDEILEGGLAPNATVMSWRGEKGGIEAAKQKHNVIMTPSTYVYLDYAQTKNEDSLVIGGYLPLEKVYNYEPYSKELTAEQAKYITGVQANLWTEYIKYPTKVEYMIFPRVSALSEIQWSQRQKKNWLDFKKRMQTQFKRYDLWKAHYSKAYYDLKASVVPAGNNGLAWKLESTLECEYCEVIAGKQFIYKKNTEVIDTIPVYHLDPARPDKLIINKTVMQAGDKGYAISTFRKSALIPISESGTWKAFQMENRTKSTDLFQSFFFNKATGKKITTTPASDNYPGSGAFTLVNAVQNETGLAKSEEFLGYNGTNCEASIDLGSIQQISTVKAHVFDRPESWIYRPAFFHVAISKDGSQYTTMGTSDLFEATGDAGNGIMTVNQKSVAARYIKVKLGNFGTIPAGNPGEGSKAWLFVDEIEVN